MFSDDGTSCRLVDGIAPDAPDPSAAARLLVRTRHPAGGGAQGDMRWGWSGGTLDDRIVAGRDPPPVTPRVPAVDVREGGLRAVVAASLLASCRIVEFVHRPSAEKSTVADSPEPGEKQ